MKIIFPIAFVFFFCNLRAQQRDTVIGGVTLHLLFTEHSDTIATAWISNAVTKTGTYYEIYPNGKIKTKGNKIKTGFAGTCDSYFSNGQLQSHGMYVNGKKKGVWKYYHDNGKLRATGNYTDGQRDGLWKTWYANDSLQSRGQYWHDHCTGTWNWYYEDGKLKAHANYRAKSKLVKKDKSNFYRYEHGTGVPFLKKKYIFYNVDSLVEYYPDGKLRSRIYYDKSGNRIGHSLFWYENGQLNREEIYTPEHPDSCWRYYCEDGTLSYIQTQNTAVVCPGPDVDNKGCQYPGDIVPLIQFDFVYDPDVRAKF